jgi:hypothetical protein
VVKLPPVDRPMAIVSCPRCGMNAGVGVDHGETVVSLGYRAFMDRCRCEPALGKECPELEKAVETSLRSQRHP